MSSPSTTLDEHYNACVEISRRVDICCQHLVQISTHKSKHIIPHRRYRSDSLPTISCVPRVFYDSTSAISLQPSNSCGIFDRIMLLLDEGYVMQCSCLQ
jgi:hypothetical protein